ncbi:MAG: guanylate kinase [Mycoplasmatales bacterium]
MRGKLIVFSGPSGVGKGTIRKEMEFSNYVFSISLTTRKPRNQEEDGVHYHFVEKEYFEERIKQGKMLEYAEFVGNYYGTDADVVENLLIEGKNVFLEIECQGALQVLEKYDDVISIYIVPPSLQELENRLVLRGTESSEIVEQRLKKAEEELNYQDKYKYVVVNDNLKHVVSEVDAILNAELPLN